VRRALVAAGSGALGVAAALTFALAMWHRHHAPRPAEPPPDCDVGDAVPGIDVSYYQETIDWRRVRRAGIRFAFIRVSDGAALRDSTFDTNWAEARRAGVQRGAYQFFRPEQSATAQADVMIAAMRHRRRDDLPPVLDLEVDGGLPLPAVVAAATAWVDRVRGALGVEPIVYSNPDFWRNGGGDPLAAQPLWLAHYTRACPTVPAPWTAWTFWQYTDRGQVPGINGNVDLDWMR